MNQVEAIIGKVLAVKEALEKNKPTLLKRIFQIK
jgi:hypothetical protein